MRDGMHDWVVANERMADALAGMDYPYQLVFARIAGHCGALRTVGEITDSSRGLGVAMERLHGTRRKKQRRSDAWRWC